MRNNNVRGKKNIYIAPIYIHILVLCAKEMTSMTVMSASYPRVGREYENGV